MSIVWLTVLYFYWLYLGCSSWTNLLLFKMEVDSFEEGASDDLREAALLVTDQSFHWVLIQESLDEKKLQYC
jgi:hypothetical protein